jgi:MFS family permease
MPKSTPPAGLVWTIWGLGAVLFLVGFYHRVAPAVITGELMREFGLNAAALGNLSAFYFYSYVAMQVPTGILADRWGPRRLLTVGALATGLGTLLFAQAPTILWANMGRLLIGGAVAVAFVCNLKLAANWLAPRQFALASGLTLLVGIIGAVSAGAPLQLLVIEYGWRPVMLVSALPAFILSLAIWFIVRDGPQEMGYTGQSYVGQLSSRADKPVEPRQTGIIAGILEVLRYRNSQLLIIIPAGIVGSLLTFSGLWGVPFLTTQYGLSAAQAAGVASTLLAAWAIGGPIFGALSDRLGRRKLPFVAGCALAALGWSALILLPGLPIALLVALLILTGLASGCMVISYAFIKESVSPHLAGTAAGLCNMGVMLGPLILQPAVGWVLDQNWQGQILNGVRVYSQAAYQAGFSLMAGWMILAFGLVFFTRETYGRQFTDASPFSENKGEKLEASKQG